MGVTHTYWQVKLRNNRTSLRRNRLVPRQQIPQTVILQSPPTHKLDVWLPRLANFTQVALLALTAGGFYFTVLPLYQKALLDEAFARKEIELKQVNETLERQYAQLRQLAVREFVIRANLDCSGIRKVLSTEADYENVEVTAFNIDLMKCLLDHEAKAPSLVELRASDRVFFRAAIAEVANRLTKLQSESKASYIRAESEINSSNVNAYASKREFSAAMLSILVKNRLIRPEDVERHKWEQAVAELKGERIQAYRSSINEQLRSLTKINWPIPQQ